MAVWLPRGSVSLISSWTLLLGICVRTGVVRHRQVHGGHSSVLTWDKGHLPAVDETDNVFQDANLQLMSSFVPYPKAEAQFTVWRLKVLSEMSSNVRKKRDASFFPTVKEDRPVNWKCSYHCPMGGRPIIHGQGWWFAFQQWIPCVSRCWAMKNYDCCKPWIKNKGNPQVKNHKFF